MRVTKCEKCCVERGTQVRGILSASNERILRSKMQIVTKAHFHKLRENKKNEKDDILIEFCRRCAFRYLTVCF